MTSYTKGKAGPVSRMRLEITDVVHIDDGAASRARGEGVAELARGRLKGVTFLVQGRNHAAARDLLVRGAFVDVTARWTGGTAITIVETHRPEQVAKAA